jgi:hypothetical protein
MERTINSEWQRGAISAIEGKNDQAQAEYYHLMSIPINREWHRLFNRWNRRWLK